jgi:protein-S-isoprenylcysteine O-methyltransferase Ste14
MNGKHTAVDHKWWWVKVGCGVLLLLAVFDRYLTQILEISVNVPVLLAQSLVFTGGVISIYHYHLLRSRNSNPTAPDVLVIDEALFQYLRHPMYLGDCILYAGLLLLAPSALSIAAAITGWVALYLQSGVEDQAMASRFGDVFENWRMRSGRLFPWL